MDEGFFSSIAASSPIGMCVVQGGKIVLANPKLLRELLKVLHPFRGRLPR